MANFPPHLQHPGPRRNRSDRSWINSVCQRLRNALRSSSDDSMDSALSGLSSRENTGFSKPQESFRLLGQVMEEREKPFGSDNSQDSGKEIDLAQAIVDFSNEGRTRDIGHREGLPVLKQHSKSYEDKKSSTPELISRGESKISFDEDAKDEGVLVADRFDSKRKESDSSLSLKDQDGNFTSPPATHENVGNKYGNADIVLNDSNQLDLDNVGSVNSGDNNFEGAEINDVGYSKTSDVNANFDVAEDLVDDRDDNVDDMDAYDLEIDDVEAEDIDAEDVDAEDFDAEDVEAEDVDVEDVEAEDVDAEDVDAEYVDAEDVDAEDVDAEDVDAEDIDAEDVDAEDVDAEDVDAEDVDAEDVDAEDVDAEDVDAEDVDAEDVDAEDVEAEDVDAEDVDESGMTSSERVQDKTVAPNHYVDESAHNQPSENSDNAATIHADYIDLVGSESEIEHDSVESPKEEQEAGEIHSSDNSIHHNSEGEIDESFVRSALHHASTLLEDDGHSNSIPDKSNSPSESHVHGMHSLEGKVVPEGKSECVEGSFNDISNNTYEKHENGQIEKSFSLENDHPNVSINLGFDFGPKDTQEKFEEQNIDFQHENDPSRSTESIITESQEILPERNHKEVRNDDGNEHEFKAGESENRKEDENEDENENENENEYAGLWNLFNVGFTVAPSTTDEISRSEPVDNRPDTEVEFESIASQADALVGGAQLFGGRTRSVRTAKQPAPPPPPDADVSATASILISQSALFGGVKELPNEVLGDIKSEEKEIEPAEYANSVQASTIDEEIPDIDGPENDDNDDKQGIESKSNGNQGASARNRRKRTAKPKAIPETQAKRPRTRAQRAKAATESVSDNADIMESPEVEAKPKPKPSRKSATKNATRRRTPRNGKTT